MKGDLANSLAFDFLISSQNQDGGWGYAAQQGSAIEPTCAVLLALRGDLNSVPSIGRAFKWLMGGQHADGGWGFSLSDTESAWQTAWAVLALERSGEAGDIVGKGVEWLLNVKTLQFSKDVMQAGKRILAIDYSLRGWPWRPGEATWIEPTALTLWALGSVPGITGSNKLINEAVRYIQDRRCPGGGWNVGNPIMFNSALPAQAHPTALVLLGFSHLAPESIHSDDIRVLRSEMRREGGVLALAWGLLALRTIGEKDTLSEARLITLQGKNGGWTNSPHITAVSMMAIRGHINGKRDY